MGKILKLSDVRKELPFKTHHVNLWWSINDIIEDNSNVDFDVWLPTKAMNLQRPLCWNLEQKQQLIVSIIKGSYIPKIAVIIDRLDGDRSEKRFQIIDGKQRLSAMLSFLRNEFPLVVNRNSYFFTECETDLKRIVSGYSPQCEAAYSYEYQNISDEDKIAWFEQINFTGTPQDEQHLLKLKS